MFSADEIGEVSIAPDLRQYISKNANEEAETTRKKVTDFMADPTVDQNEREAERPSYNDGVFEITPDFYRYIATIESPENANPQSIEVRAKLLALKLENQSLENQEKQYAAYSHTDFKWHKFKESPNGKLVLDVNQLATINGTSFAAPTRLRTEITGEPPSVIEDEGSLPQTHSQDQYNAMEYVLNRYDMLTLQAQQSNTLLPGQKLTDLDAETLEQMSVKKDELEAVSLALESYAKTGVLPTEADAKKLRQLLVPPKLPAIIQPPFPRLDEEPAPGQQPPRSAPIQIPPVKPVILPKVS
jgi:hypothetical protein